MNFEKQNKIEKPKRNSVTFGEVLMGDKGKEDVPLWEVVKQAYKRLETFKEAYGSLCTAYRAESTQFLRDLQGGPPTEETAPVKKKGLFGIWGGGGNDNGGVSPRNGENHSVTVINETDATLYRRKRMGALKRMIKVMESVETKVAPVFEEFQTNLDSLILFELPDDTIKQYITSRSLLELYNRQKRAARGAK